MAQNKTRIIMIETNNPETLEIKRKDNIPNKTINVCYDDYCTAIREIGEGASILRFDRKGTLSIVHDYLNPIGALNADEAEQMAYELLAAASELRKIEREHAKNGE